MDDYDDIYASDKDDEVNSEGKHDVVASTLEEQEDEVLSGQEDLEFVNVTAEAFEGVDKKAEANRKRREREKRKRDEKREPVKAVKSGKGTSTAKSKVVPINIADSDDDCSDDDHTTKKRKQEAAVLNQKVTVYINVQSPPRPAPTTRTRSKVEPTPVAVKGPCFFHTVQTYQEFLDIIAKTLPCKLALLPSTQMTWKYEKPANDTKKPLTSFSGYEAMLMSLKGRKVNHVIQVFMPPPKANDVCWDTGDGDYVSKPYDHDEEVGSVHQNQDLSAKAQIAAIKTDASGHLRHLMEQYPVGNIECFPNSRIFRRMHGDKAHYWELTRLRLEVWANALSVGKDGVTIYNPPNSLHFDISACVKPKINEGGLPRADGLADNAIPAQNVPQPPPPMYPQVPQQQAYAPPYNMPPPPAWMYGFNQMPGAYMYPPPMAPYAAFLNGHQGGAFPARDSPASSPGTALQLRIPLSNFCDRYDISKSDQEKLSLLEYKPGNNIVLTLTPDEWKEVNFTSLGWRSFIAAHKRFIRDAKDGLWDGV